ncbi:AAA family ATPase [Tumebacillus sp. ITR2]|uniref:AAA family ATPase n=1 Tax=Tumebacillus amylolyticus TaxID=2801339 RepID=A0ABS1JGW3_9BACL|nr:AAA family ATPase [Tumebacillus amylolyticus]MBL0389501.1 AAA family ATPase [Tumebacillus amylolyticus]
MIHKKEIADHLRRFLGKGSQVKLHWVFSQTADLFAVSDRFRDLGLEQRQEIIRQWQKSVDPSLKVMLMSLYTPEEVVELRIQMEDEETKTFEVPTTWLELMDWGLQGNKIKKVPQNPKTIAFYSFKGGVGRTTALVHSAWSLAAKGKRVVMVDLDFEAPSLHRTQKMTVPDKGLVDYLYERTNLFGDDEPKISIADTIGEIDVPRGKLFVVSAGKVDMDYIAKVDDLRNLSIYDHRLWEDFREELVEQLQPDLILIDSRTGINVWGALSMLMISDKSILFMNPNPQNSEGMDTILTSLIKVGIEPHVVMSPVLGDIGREKAMRLWKNIDESMEQARGVSRNQERAFIGGGFLAEPIIIPYASEIAIADEYPVPAFREIYEKIVDVLQDESDKQKLQEILSGHERWEIIESLPFGPVELDGEVEVERFQRTADYDRFIDPSTILIRGKKGTGKTQLYRMALHHFDVLKKWSPRSLGHVTPVAAYGQGAVTLKVHQRKEIGDELAKRRVDWESFWWLDALMSITHESSDQLNALTDVQKWLELIEKWTPDTKREIQELVQLEGHRLILSKESVWLLYDDVDQLPVEQLIGLLTFAVSLDKMGLKQIRPKIFLRDDIWDQIDFVEKKSFVGRNIELKWSEEDSYRFVFNQAMRSEKFAELVKELVPGFDRDQVDDYVLETALGLLWGYEWHENEPQPKVSNVVHGVLSDAENQVLPGTLMKMLDFSKRLEITKRELGEVPSKSNRLFQKRTLWSAVKATSKFCCQEIRGEYPKLNQCGFFDFLETLPRFTPNEPLRDWWQENAASDYPTFDAFLMWMKQIGLILTVESSVFFPNIYAIGFGMVLRENT